MIYVIHDILDMVVIYFSDNRFWAIYNLADNKKIEKLCSVVLEQTAMAAIMHEKVNCVIFRLCI